MSGYDEFGRDDHLGDPASAGPESEQGERGAGMSRKPSPPDWSFACLGPNAITRRDPLPLELLASGGPPALRRYQRKLEAARLLGKPS